MIPVTLLCRAIAVAVPVSLVMKTKESTKSLTKILTWGGLRGGISIALALSLPLKDFHGDSIPERGILIAITYIIVLFSILVQGLTIKHVVRKTLHGDAAK